MTCAPAATGRVNRPIRIYGVAGHMHLRGFDIQARAEPARAAPGRCCTSRRWHFHWQDAYYLGQPVDAEPGDTIRVTCQFDNSAIRQPL